MLPSFVRGILLAPAITAGTRRSSVEEEAGSSAIMQPTDFETVLLWCTSSFFLEERWLFLHSGKCD
jgi:hypothetical protein